MWIRSPLEEVKYFALVSRRSAALSSSTQHAMPPEFSGKWGTECINTRFPLPTLLCVGYSVKLKYKWSINKYNEIGKITYLRIFAIPHCAVFGLKNICNHYFPLRDSLRSIALRLSREHVNINNFVTTEIQT